MSNPDPAEEAERRRQKRGLESRARHGQIPDPVHAFKVSTPDRPGAYMYLLARWSTEGRLVSDAAEPGAMPGEAVDLGPLPLHLTGPPGAMLIIGVRHHGQWASITKGCEALAAACLDLERSRSLTVR